MTLAYVMEGAAYAGETINITQFFSEEGVQVALLGAGAAIAEGNLQLAYDIIIGPAKYNAKELFDNWVVYGWLNPPVWMGFAYYWLAAQSTIKRTYSKILARDSEFDEKSSTNQEKRSIQNCKDKMMNLLDNGGSFGDCMNLTRSDIDCEKFIDNYQKTFGLGGLKNFWTNVEEFTKYGDTGNRAGILSAFHDAFRGSQLQGQRLYGGNPSKTKKTGASKRQLSQAVSNVWHTMNIIQKNAYRSLPNGSSYFGYKIFYDRFYSETYNLQENFKPPAYGHKQIGIGTPSEEREIELQNNQTLIKTGDKPLLHGSYKYTKGRSTLDPVGIFEIDTGYFYILKDFKGELRLQCSTNSEKISDYLIATEGKKGDIIKVIYFPVKPRSTQIVLNKNWGHLLEADAKRGEIRVRYPSEYFGGGKIHFKKNRPTNNSETTNKKNK